MQNILIFRPTGEALSRHRHLDHCFTGILVLGVALSIAGMLVIGRLPLVSFLFKLASLASWLWTVRLWWLMANNFSLLKKTTVVTHEPAGIVSTAILRPALAAKKTALGILRSAPASTAVGAERLLKSTTRGAVFNIYVWNPLMLVLNLVLVCSQFSGKFS